MTSLRYCYFVVRNGEDGFRYATRKTTGPQKAGPLSPKRPPVESDFEGSGWMRTMGRRAAQDAVCPTFAFSGKLRREPRSGRPKVLVRCALFAKSSLVLCSRLETVAAPQPYERCGPPDEGRRIPGGMRARCRSASPFARTHSMRSQSAVLTYKIVATKTKVTRE